jgi:A/G-specific adenine glycosylase
MTNVHAVPFCLDEAKRRAPRIRKALLSWAEKALRDYPWRRNRTAYSVLIAEFLLKRTTATAASRLYEKFLGKYPDVTTLARASTKELERLLTSIGYQYLRARELKTTAGYIVKEFKAELPEDLKSLLTIPNVGLYTAGAIMSLGYGKRATMIDSNALRVVSRIFKNSMPVRCTSKAIMEIAEILLPNKQHDIFNLAIIDLGGTICIYGIPRCKICSLPNHCDIGIANTDCLRHSTKQIMRKS